MEDNNEVWKDIPGWEGYQISNLGRVKSLKRGKTKILSSNICSHGYPRINLSCIGKRKRSHIHLIVAEVFLGHIRNEGRFLVDHINSDKMDNRVENLRIVTPRENASKEYEKPNKTSRYTGVDFRDGKWRSRISVSKKLINLGVFNTEEEARDAYLKAVKELEINSFIKI